MWSGDRIQCLTVEFNLNIAHIMEEYEIDRRNNHTNDQQGEGGSRPNAERHLADLLRILPAVALRLCQRDQHFHVCYVLPIVVFSTRRLKPSLSNRNETVAEQTIPFCVQSLCNHVFQQSITPVKSRQNISATEQAVLHRRG